MKLSDVVIVAFIGAVPSTIASVASWRAAEKASADVKGVQTTVATVANQVEVVHKATNSMKDALVAGASREGVAKGKAQGIVQGKAQEKQRQSELPLFQRGR